MGHVNPFVHIVPYAPLILNTRGTWSVWPLISFPYPRDPFAHTTLATFLHSRWANGTRVRLGMSMEEAIASHVVPSGSLIKTFTHSCYGPRKTGGYSYNRDWHRSPKEGYRILTVQPSIVCQSRSECE